MSDDRELVERVAAEWAFWSRPAEERHDKWMWWVEKQPELAEVTRRTVRNMVSIVRAYDAEQRARDTANIHASDCSLHNGPAYPPGPCDCGALAKSDQRTATISSPRSIPLSSSGSTHDPDSDRECPSSLVSPPRPTGGLTEFKRD